MAVRITKFITSATNGILILSKTSTNDAVDTPDSFIGKSNAKMRMVKTKKITKRTIVVLIAFGTASFGLSVSPVAIPMSSAPEKA